MTAVSDVFTAYRKRIEDGFSEFCPYDKKTLFKFSRNTEIVSYVLLCAVSFVLILLNGCNLFSALSVIMTSYIFLNEIPEIITYFLRIKFYPELMAYFSSVRKKYIKLSNIPESIVEASTGRKKEICENARELKDILLTVNRRTAVREYVGTGKRNAYLKLFLIQAYSASEYGDEVNTNGMSVFGENIELIREEIIREMYNLKKKYFVLSGYIFVAVMPVVLFSLIKAAGNSMTDELGGFYACDGKTVLLFAFLCSFFVYLVISGAKNIRQNKTEKVLKSPGALKRIAEREDISGIKFLKKIMGEEVSTNEIGACLTNVIASGMGTLLLSLMLKIYKNTFGIAAMLLMTVTAAIMPILKILLNNTATKKETVNEIKSLETVLIMESGLKSMSVLNLLCDLELFAIIFGREIRECINTLPSGMNEAFLNLKNNGIKKHIDFSAIAEGFLAVDEVGIAGAFGDIKLNKECSEKMQELEDMISLEKNRNLLDIIAWIPAVIMIFGYFILPFLFVTLKEMEGVFELFTGV